jgi:hypothetical protein
MFPAQWAAAHQSEVVQQVQLDLPVEVGGVLFVVLHTGWLAMERTDPIEAAHPPVRCLVAQTGLQQEPGRIDWRADRQREEGHCRAMRCEGPGVVQDRDSG